MPLYIVSGDGPRCGSSMMMRALAEGGMEVVFEPSQDVIGENIFELSHKTMYSSNFPQPALRDRVVKMFPWPWSPLGAEILPLMPPLPAPPVFRAMPCRILWLHRPSEDRRASFARVHNNTNMSLAKDDGVNVAWNWRDASARYILALLRMNFDITELNYYDILEDPKKELGKIGWPFDVEKAASIIDPDKRRI